MRTRTVRCLAVSALLLIAQATWAQNEPTRDLSPRHKVFAVADLVVPAYSQPEAHQTIQMMACCPQAGMWSPAPCPSTQANVDRLIHAITAGVCPRCWTQAGGSCSIEYFPVGMGLVVNAPEHVQREVLAYLEKLRHPTDSVIQVALRFITVNDEFFERYGLDFDLNCPVKSEKQ